MDEKNVVFDNTQLPQQPVPEQNPPQQVAEQPGAPQQPVPEQGVPQQVVSQQAVPEQPLSEQGVSQEAQQEVAATDPADLSLETAVPPPPPGSGGLIKKIIIGVVIFIVVVFLLFLMIPKNQNVKSVSLVWWGLWEDERVMQILIADYRKTHPNINIRYTKRTPQQYRETLLARITGQTSGEKPDIFRYHNTWLPMMKDVLSPLSSDVITPEEFKKSYYPVMQSDLVRDGAIYGIPLEADCLALFVNTKLLDQAGAEVPKNWDEFAKTVKNPKLLIRDENGKIVTAGGALGTYKNITHAPDIISLLFALEGVDMKKFSGGRRDQAVLFYTGFAKGEQPAWDMSLNDSKLAFAKGNLAMYIGFSWDVFDIQKLNQNLQFEIHPVPELPNNKKVTIASYWVEGVSSKSPHQKEALEFMHYLTEKETLQKFFASSTKIREFGEPYPRVDMAESLKDNKLVYPFVSQMKYATSSYFASRTFDGDAGLNTSLNAYLEKGIDSAVSENEDMISVFEKLDAGIKQVFEK